MEEDKNSVAVTDAADVTSTAMVCAGEENGLEDLQPEDFVVPICSIVQEKSKIGERSAQPDEIGKIYNPVTGCVAEVISVIPIVFAKTRLMMPSEYEENNRPVCGSLDFQYPSDVFANPKDDTNPTIQAGPCATCPYAQWSKNKAGKPKPPACWEVWNFLFLGDDFSPFWMRFKVTALAGAKRYVSALQIAMQIQKGKMWHFRSDLRVVKGSKAWEPLFGKPLSLDEETRAELNEIRTAMSALRPPHGRAGEKEGDFPF